VPDLYDKIVCMSTIESLTEQLRDLSIGYAPNHEELTGLNSKELVMAVGPFLVGKTTTMEVAETLDPEFKRVVGFTTRLRRPGESEGVYDFIPHDVPHLEKLKSRAQAGDLAQFVVHPTNGNIYGADVDSFRGRYSMLDTLPESVGRYAALPFHDTHIIGLATPPSIWADRFAARSQSGAIDTLQGRLREGIDNIEWSLDQGDNLRWIVNGPRPVEDSARHVIGLVRGHYGPSPDGRKVAEALRATMQEMLNS
jgi:hypothetical protein